MALQLKNENTTSDHGSMDGTEKQVNPWDNPVNQMNDEKPYQMNRTIQSTYVPEKGHSHVLDMIIKLVIFLIAAGLLIMVGKTIVAKLMPEGTDVTSMLEKPEVELESALGISLTDNTTWASNMIQYSGGEMAIRSNEDIGVVYIDKKRVGMHINSNKYTMYGIQVGMAEQKVYDTLSNNEFKADNFLELIDDSGKKGTTTYYYYNQSRNDCIAIVLSESTNRVVAMTYYNNYKLIMKNADSF